VVVVRPPLWDTKGYRGPKKLHHEYTIAPKKLQRGVVTPAKMKPPWDKTPYYKSTKKVLKSYKSTKNFIKAKIKKKKQVYLVVAIQAGCPKKIKL